VVDVPKFHLFVDPDSVPAALKDPTAAGLAHCLELSGLDALAVRQEVQRKSRSRKVATWLSRETRDRVETWWREFGRQNKLPRNAIYFVSDYQRSYPFGSML